MVAGADDTGSVRAENGQAVLVRHDSESMGACNPNDHSVGAPLNAIRARNASENKLVLDMVSHFESSTNPMWIFDIHTLAFLAVNDAAIHHYGYSRQEFISMTILDIRPTEDIVRLLREELRDGRHSASRDLWRHRKKDGMVTEVKITSYEVIFNGLSAEVVLVEDVAKQGCPA